MGLYQWHMEAVQNEALQVGPPPPPQDLVPFCCPRVGATIGDEDGLVIFDAIACDRRMAWSPSFQPHNREYVDEWLCHNCLTCFSRAHPLVPRLSNVPMDSANLDLVDRLRPLCCVHGPCTLLIDLARAERCWACTAYDGVDIPTVRESCPTRDLNIMRYYNNAFYIPDEVAANMVVVDSSDDEVLPSVGDGSNVVGDQDMDTWENDAVMAVADPWLEGDLERLAQIAVSDELDILARIAEKIYC